MADANFWEYFMSEIAQIRAAKFQESENKRYDLELRKLRKEHQAVYAQEVKKHDKTMERLSKDFTTETSNLESELEQRLVELREKQKDTLITEKRRLQEEIDNLKKSHQDRVGELKESQDNQIEEMMASHKSTLDNAQEKFKREKMKLES